MGQPFGRLFPYLSTRRRRRRARGELRRVTIGSTVYFVRPPKAKRKAAKPARVRWW